MLKDKKVEITKKDYLAFRYFAFLYDYTGLVTVFWVCILSAFVLVDYIITRRNLLIALIAVFMPASYINSIFFKLPKTAKEEYDSGAFSNPKFTLSLTGDTLSILRENSKVSEIQLTKLYSAFETYRQFCFFVSKNNYIILPKNLLTDEETKFVHKTVKSLPRANRKNPFQVELRTTLKNLFMLIFITICAVIMIISYKMT